MKALRSLIISNVTGINWNSLKLFGCLFTGKMSFVGLIPLGLSRKILASFPKEPPELKFRLWFFFVQLQITVKSLTRMRDVMTDLHFPFSTPDRALLFCSWRTARGQESEGSIVYYYYCLLGKLTKIQNVKYHCSQLATVFRGEQWLDALGLGSGIENVHFRNGACIFQVNSLLRT